MNKTQFLILIIIGLLISNGILLFMHINRPGMNGGPRNLIIEKLHFDKEQVQKYDVIIENHRYLVRENEDLMNQSRTELYQELVKPQDSAKINALIFKISSLQDKSEKIHYNHFLDIKKICNTSQQNDFVDLTKELSQLFSKNRANHPPRN